MLGPSASQVKEGHGEDLMLHSQGGKICSQNDGVKASIVLLLL